MLYAFVDEGRAQPRGAAMALQKHVRKSFQQLTRVQPIFVYVYLLFSAAVSAAPGSHLVADTTTPVFGLSGTLDEFGVPGFNGDVVSFSAKRGGVRGIYVDYFDGFPEVRKLAELTDRTPDGDTYLTLAEPAAQGNGQAVAFSAQTSSGYGTFWSTGSSVGLSTLAHAFGGTGDCMAVAPTGVFYCGDHGIFFFGSASGLHVPGRSPLHSHLFRAVASGQQRNRWTERWAWHSQVPQLRLSPCSPIQTRPIPTPPR